MNKLAHTLFLINFVLTATDLEALSDSTEFNELLETPLTKAFVADTLSPSDAATFWFNYNEAYSYLV